jgi:energy-coupling factor transporter ATP-binding protein EcfA2
MTRIWISEIEFNDGTKITLGADEIVVLVGPNNSGKSATLKESLSLLKSKVNAKQTSKVLRDLIISKEGDETSFKSFLESVSTKNFLNNPEPHFQGFGFNIYAPYIGNSWDNYESGLGEVAALFVNMLGTEDRLKLVNPAPNIKLTTEAISHPIHFLQKHDELEAKFSNYFRQAFGTDLIVHRNAGSEVPLYVGEKPVLSTGEDRVSENYLTELEKRDLLHEQGDGMRSFVGVLLMAFISHHSILFIDEPEAFLHPPQARLLGRMLAKDLPEKRQLFLATHSEDFLKGLLDSNVSNLRVIRIQRIEAINKVSVLNSQDIGNIWRDSLLRYSNILNGLFHTKVVICESDSDCRFYSTILSSLYDNTNEISPDILFIHCGGKHRIPVVVKSLMKLNVPIKVISDFDVLNDKNPLFSIYSELGGNWLDIEKDWKMVKNSIGTKGPELKTSELKKEIDEILESVEEQIFPKEKIKQINNSLKKASAWAHAKAIGKPFIPNGDATQAFDRLQVKLKSVGLLVLEVGELEGFVQSVGNHGPKWVVEVLTKDLKNDPELEGARQFVKQLIS